MSIPATDLLAFAQALSADANLQEAGCRAAVSRAYYAAYHDTEQWHRQLPAPGSLGVSKATGMHAQLCARLQTPDVSLKHDLKLKSRQRGYALRAFSRLPYEGGLLPGRRRDLNRSTPSHCGRKDHNFPGLTSTANKLLAAL